MHKRRGPSYENEPWLLVSDRPLANARGSATLSNQGSCYRAATVREWLLTFQRSPSPHFRSSFVSRAHEQLRYNLHALKRANHKVTEAARVSKRFSYFVNSR